MTTLQIFEHIISIYSILFIYYMYFRWSTKTSLNILVKTSLFVAANIGLVIELIKVGIIK